MKAAGGRGAGEEVAEHAATSTTKCPQTLDWFVPDTPAGCPFKVGETVQLSDGKVNYLLEGPPAPSEIVVCLHGLNSSMALYEKFCPRLWQRGFRTLTYDYYGHGLSGSPRTRYNEATYAKQLEELLSVVAPDVGKIAIVAFSIGGIVATEFACKHPHRVSHLLLVAPVGLLDKSQTPFSGFLFNCLRTPFGCCVVPSITWFVRLCLCGVCRCWCRPGLRKYQPIVNSVTPDVGKPEDFADLARINLDRLFWDGSRTANTYFKILRQMPMWEDDFEEAYETLSRGPVPVLFMWGEMDGTVPLDEVKEGLTRIFASSETACIIVEGSGHHVLLEFPDYVAKCAAAWFANSQDSKWKECLAHARLRPATEQTEVPKLSGFRAIQRGGVVTYAIEIAGPFGLKRVVHRRYKEFLALYIHLSENIADLPPMPPKSFFRKKFSQGFMDRRKEGLAAILVAALGADPCLSNLELLNFLRLAESPRLEPGTEAWAVDAAASKSCEGLAKIESESAEGRTKEAWSVDVSDQLWDLFDRSLF